MFPTGKFDPSRFFKTRDAQHHGSALGVVYHDHGDDWVELALPYAPHLIGDESSGVIASGPVITLLDQATSASVWMARGAFLPHATLDLRIDYLRAATPGKTVVGRGECYRLTRSIAFVRGTAHDGDASDPLAHVAGTFMVTEMGAGA